jgi:hypothetical protein
MAGYKTVVHASLITDFVGLALLAENLFLSNGSHFAIFVAYPFTP